MSRFGLVAFLLLTKLMAFAVPCASQGPDMAVGIHAGYNFNDLNEPMIGGHVLVSLPHRLALYPSGSYYLTGFSSLWLLSASIRWEVVPPRLLAPYVAVGGYWSRITSDASSSTDLGFLGELGAEVRLSPLRPFVEVEFLKDGAVSSQIVAGLRLPVGG